MVKISWKCTGTFKINGTIFLYLRLQSGLFSAPIFQFPAKKAPPTYDEKVSFGTLLQPGDLLTTRSVVAGTDYRKGQIVVISVTSDDVLTVGIILSTVIRKDCLLFIVSVHDAIRTPWRFFQSCPREVIDIVDYKCLGDFKPLVKRDQSNCFRFVLHHYLPSPLS